MTTSSPPTSAGLLIAILLVAANLRVTLTGVGTLLPAIERDTGLTASAGGVLNTVPLVMFAATSPFAGRVSHRAGTTRLLVVALAALVVGTVVRSLPSIACLFAGTVILTAAIAVGDVLLPTVIRTHVRGRHDQRFIAAAAAVIAAAGFTILLLLPSLAVVACTLLGLGNGACLVLALSFQSQRATGSSETTALAGMGSVGRLPVTAPGAIGTSASPARSPDAERVSITHRPRPVPRGLLRLRSFVTMVVEGLALVGYAMTGFQPIPPPPEGAIPRQRTGSD